ncbi:MAG: hypothetical protein K2Y22_03690 [Candidatus Obscuribacterales bacterium]|nr:hypothetical protein [Candidatus Obscuribacterales bacterium]
MRLPLLLASVIVVLQPLWSLSALAAMISYDRPTNAVNIQGRLDAKRIGKVKLDKSAVVMSGNKVDIIFESVDLTEKVDDSQKQLTGTTFKTNFEGHNTEGRVTGLLLLEGGSSLPEFDIPGTNDTVKLTDGTTHTGKIVSCTDKYLQIQTDITNRTIDTANIAEITSPRVFKFEMPVRTSSDMTGKAKVIADASQITFTPTMALKAEAKKTVKSEPKKAESKGEKQVGSMSRKKKIIIMSAIGLCLIATAIAVPIAVACGTSGGGSDNRKAAEQLVLFNALRSQ